uniref:60S ribosomal protein L18a-like protein n=1 Tax=Ananas comosus var. bracteatus TaxID=296719 RepID=A0A6V7QUW6_ANACO
MELGQLSDAKDCGVNYTLLRDEETLHAGIFDKPLPCFGCGLGWFSFLVGFLCPLFWYYATVLYLCNHYRKDPRERAGLAASAIAASICTVAAFITTIAILI